MRLKFLANNKILGNSSGFTLLEVIIAMAIMVVAFASILAVEQGSINASARAKQMNIVGMLAHNQMVETEYKIEGKNFTEVKPEESGTFPAPYEDYRWKTAITELKFPDLSALMGAAGGSGGKDGADKGGGGSGLGGMTPAGSDASMTDMLTKLISQYLSKAVRIVTVTVFWKRGNGEQSFSLSTYWVNLNAEFQITQ